LLEARVEELSSVVDLGQVPAYLLVCAVIIATPGTDIFLLLRTAIHSGTRAGFLALGGIYAAVGLQLVLSSCGLGVVLTRHPAALAVVRWAGFAYLIYLAASLVHGVVKGVSCSEQIHAAADKPFQKGFLTNITNPKMLLFSIALLPQFIGSGEPTMQLALLAAVFVVLAAGWESVIVLAAGRVACKLRRPRVIRALDVACAAVFAGIAVSIVL
jgi:threonine/homoserine/homoserine lactone efflux protein